MTFVTTIVDILQEAGVFAVVISPFVAIMVSILYFQRRAHASYRALLIVLILGVVAAIVGYQYALAYVCDANPDPRFKRTTYALLFAAPASFSLATAICLIANAMLTRGRPR